MGNTETKGLQRLVNATRYTFAGFKAAWKEEEAFRQELMLFAFMVPAGLLLGANATQRALLIGCGFIIIITELLNSAVEAIVDRVGLEHHPLAGRAKDMGSAAVFVSLSAAAVIWSLIAFERLLF